MDHHTAARVFSLTGNDAPVEGIITKLKFISKIKSGEKINVRRLFVRDDKSPYQRLMRTVNDLTVRGESKSETLEFIKFVIDDAINLICVYKSDPNDAFKMRIADMIVQNLNESKQGLSALTGTYSGDILFVSQIEAVMQTLDARISSLMTSLAPSSGAGTTTHTTTTHHTTTHTAGAGSQSVSSAPASLSTPPPIAISRGERGERSSRHHQAPPPRFPQLYTASSPSSASVGQLRDDSDEE